MRGRKGDSAEVTITGLGSHRRLKGPHEHRCPTATGPQLYRWEHVSHNAPGDDGTSSQSREATCREPPSDAEELSSRATAAPTGPPPRCPTLPARLLTSQNVSAVTAGSHRTVLQGTLNCDWRRSWPHSPRPVQTAKDHPAHPPEIGTRATSGPAPKCPPA